MTFSLFVFQLPKEEKIINSSPFCIKMITFFKVAKIDHTVVHDNQRLLKSDKKKLPCIEEDGKIYSDSRLIIQRYKQKGTDLDKKLNSNDAALSVAFQRMVEEHTYWYIVCSRWIRNWDYVSKTYFYMIPWILSPIKLFIGWNMKKQLYSVGTTRLSYDEQYLLVKQDLIALETLLQDSKTVFYFSSATPTNLDIVVFSFVFALVCTPFNDRAATYAKHFCPKVMKLISEMLSTYFPIEWIYFSSVFNK